MFQLVQKSIIRQCKIHKNITLKYIPFLVYYPDQPMHNIYIYISNEFLYRMTSHKFRCNCFIFREPYFLFAKLTKSVRLQNQQKSIDSNVYTCDHYRRFIRYNLQNIENCINYYYSDLHILLYQMTGFVFSIETCKSVYDIKVIVNIHVVHWLVYIMDNTKCTVHT